MAASVLVLLFDAQSTRRDAPSFRSVKTKCYYFMKQCIFPIENGSPKFVKADDVK